MKNVILLLAALLLASASAFAPQPFGVRVQSQSVVCFAKHAQKKAAKLAAHKRPKKSRPSDINKTPRVYELHSMQKPSEYKISEAPATPLTKPEKN